MNNVGSYSRFEDLKIMLNDIDDKIFQEKLGFYDKSKLNNQLQEFLVDYCIFNDKQDMLKCLLDLGDFDFDLEYNNKTLVSLAFERENIEILKLILSNQNIDINQECNNKTALLLAIEKENIEIIKLLLSNPSIDVNQNSICFTILQYISII